MNKEPAMTTLEIKNDIAHRKMLTGMFHDPVSAENAFNTLFEKGYAHDEVNVVMSEDTRKKYFLDKSAIEAFTEKGLGTSSIIGGAIGAVTGVLASIGVSLIFPGLGLVVAGPIASGIAGFGGLTGSVVGALMGIGIPKEYANKYDDAIKKGSVLMCVYPREGDLDYLGKKWKENDARDMCI